MGLIPEIQTIRLTKRSLLVDYDCVIKIKLMVSILLLVFLFKSDSERVLPVKPVIAAKPVRTAEQVLRPTRKCC